MGEDLIYYGQYLPCGPRTFILWSDVISAGVTAARWRRAVAAKMRFRPFTQRWAWKNKTHITHTFMNKTEWTHTDERRRVTHTRTHTGCVSNHRAPYLDNTIIHNTRWLMTIMSPNEHYCSHSDLTHYLLLLSVVIVCLIKVVFVIFLAVNHIYLIITVMNACFYFTVVTVNE